MLPKDEILIYIYAENKERGISYLEDLEKVVKSDMDLSKLAGKVEYNASEYILSFSLEDSNIRFCLAREDKQENDEENSEKPDIILFLEEFGENFKEIFYRKIFKFDEIQIKYPGTSAHYVFVNFQKNISEKIKINELLEKISGNGELYKIFHYMVRYNFFSDDNVHSEYIPDVEIIYKYPFWFAGQKYKTNRNFSINHYANVNSISLCLKSDKKYLGYKEVILRMFKIKKEKDELKNMNPIIKRFAVVGYTGSGKTHLLYDILKSIKYITEDMYIEYNDSRQYENRGLGCSFMSALENQWEYGIQKTRSDYIVPENIIRISLTSSDQNCWAIEFLDIAGEIFTEKTGHEFIYSIIQNKFDQILENIKIEYKLNSTGNQLKEEILNFDENKIISDKQNKTLNAKWADCFKIISGSSANENEEQKGAAVADIVDKAARSFIGFLFIKSCEEIYCCVEPDIKVAEDAENTKSVGANQSASPLLTALSNKLTAIVINKIDIVLNTEQEPFVSYQNEYEKQPKNSLLSKPYIEFYTKVTELAKKEFEKYKRNYGGKKLYHSSSAFDYNMKYYKPVQRQFFRNGVKLDQLKKGRFSSDIFTLKMLKSFGIISSRDLYDNSLNKIMNDDN